MEMDIDVDSRAKGYYGRGKSNFCEQVMRLSTRSWVRICQCSQCFEQRKKCVYCRCNLDREQHAEFVKLGSSKADVHAVMLDLPAKLCISRSVMRSGHEGNLQGGKTAAVVNRMLQKKELPKLSEGFTRITFCQPESDVQDALNTYSALGPLDTLPEGTFGQKSPDGKVQVGIMKFFKKKQGDFAPTQIAEKKDPCLREPLSISDNVVKEVKEHEHTLVGSIGDNVPRSEAPTLAFPSISTSDFQFNHEKASDIIIEKVEEFINKIGNARLILVDLTHGSKISSLFFTFAGDITQIHSKGGLHCNVIANAANWRLKPGGGGVNAAIFAAAGPVLEAVTKEKAKSLVPGSAVVVPLPSTCPLSCKEGVSHVIHVLGPNMNPQRPNCLNNDYVTGCKILRDAYTSLFEGFASIIRTQTKLPKGDTENIGSKQSESQGHCEDAPRNSEQKIKRDTVHESDRAKKCKGSHSTEGLIPDSGAVKTNRSDEKSEGSTTKAWGSWAQALYHTAMQPEKHKDTVLKVSDDVVVIYDVYPRAWKHLLVLARHKGLDRLADICEEHLQLLKTMHAVGLKWADKFFKEDASLIFRLGYHSVPSMRQLHLHLISQDFDSKHLKNKKHWNSFNTAFFHDSVDIIEEVSSHGKAGLEENEKLLSMELRCNQCRSAHPNIPRLKSHISNCQVPFPANLLQNGRLVSASSDAGNDP
ncbi:hypothetical protein UlMin_043895 [Ulmus minor]